MSDQFDGPLRQQHGAEADGRHGSAVCGNRESFGRQHRELRKDEPDANLAVICGCTNKKGGHEGRPFQTNAMHDYTKRRSRFVPSSVPRPLRDGVAACVGFAAG